MVITPCCWKAAQNVPRSRNTQNRSPSLLHSADCESYPQLTLQLWVVITIPPLLPLSFQPQVWKNEITQKLLVQVAGIAQKGRGWLQGQEGEGCWVTWAMAASLSASPSRKILTLSIFTGTVLPLHSTSLMVAACFARVWVISACTEHTQLRSFNLQGCKTQPPQFMLDIETKGLSGKMLFPTEPRLACSLLFYSGTWMVCCSNIHAQHSNNEGFKLRHANKLPPVFLQEDLQCHQTSASSASTHSWQTGHLRESTNWDHISIWLQNYFHIQNLTIRFYTDSLGTSLQFHSGFIGKLPQTVILSFYT